ncbi:MAG: hypothetical protein HOO96_04715 [Polyangiaceae bacterium]|nr:hypothetical protein [Polyangiaceae bacterium]
MPIFEIPSVRALFCAGLVAGAALGPLLACTGDTTAEGDDELRRKKDAGSDANAADAKANDGSTADAGAVDLQLADVAILFPLPKNATESRTGLLGGTAAGPRGPLLPESVYNAVGKIAGDGPAPVGGTGTAPYANLRVVALRVDPCFAALAPSPHGDGCKNQLRLVFQEVLADGSGAFDSALHVFYSITREELTTLTRAIVTERQRSAGGQRLGALGPHPIMVRQGLAGSMATAVRDLAIKYAGSQNLTRVTTMSSGNTGFSWAFAGFDVQNATSGTVTPMHIPTLPSGNDTAQTFFRGFGRDPQGNASPATTSADNLMAFGDVDEATALTPAQRAAAYDALLRVEHPAKHSPDTIDCVSCHLATPGAKLVAEPKFGLSRAGNPNAFAPDGTFVRASEMTPSFDDAGSLNVHAFSYNGVRPGINQRTVNEAAAVVHYLATNVFAGR